MSQFKNLSVDRLVQLCWWVCCRWILWGVGIEVILGLFSIGLHQLGPRDLSQGAVFLIILLYHLVDVMAWCFAFFLSFSGVMHREFVLEKSK